jgi:hypothetical protein
MLEAAFLGLIPDTQLYKDLTVQSYPSMTLSGARPNQLLGINDLIDWPRTYPSSHRIEILVNKVAIVIQ